MKKYKDEIRFFIQLLGVGALAMLYVYISR